jgi:hypothetical protein
VVQFSAAGFLLQPCAVGPRVAGPHGGISSPAANGGSSRQTKK